MSRKKYNQVDKTKFEWLNSEANELDVEMWCGICENEFDFYKSCFYKNTTDVFVLKLYSD